MLKLSVFLTDKEKKENERIVKMLKSCENFDMKSATRYCHEIYKED